MLQKDEYIKEFKSYIDEFNSSEFSAICIAEEYALFKFERKEHLYLFVGAYMSDEGGELQPSCSRIYAESEEELNEQLKKYIEKNTYNFDIYVKNRIIKKSPEWLPVTFTKRGYQAAWIGRGDFGYRAIFDKNGGKKHAFVVRNHVQARHDYAAALVPVNPGDIVVYGKIRNIEKDITKFEKWRFFYKAYVVTPEELELLGSSFVKIKEIANPPEEAIKTAEHFARKFHWDGAKHAVLPKTHKK